MKSLAVGVAAAFFATAATAECLTAERAQRGFTFELSDGTKGEVIKADGSPTVRIQEQLSDGKTTSKELHHGLGPLRSGYFVWEYDREVTGFGKELGTVNEYSVTVLMSGRKVVSRKHESVSGAEIVMVGPCSYQARVVLRVSEGDDGRWVTVQSFAPDLRLVLRTLTIGPTGGINSVWVEHIEPAAR